MERVSCYLLNREGNVVLVASHRMEETYFLIAKTPSTPLWPTALYTRPYVPLLMKPTILYRSRTWTLLVYPDVGGF